SLVGSVTISCMVIGVATAWALARLQLPARPLFVVLAALPLAIPSYVAAFGWMAMVPGIRGFFWSWLVLTAVSCPLVTLPTLAAFSNADHSVVETARSLGRRPARAWCTAMLPQIAPAAAAGGLLVALYVLSEYGAVSALRLSVFTHAIIDNFRTLFGIDAALALALVLVALAVMLVVLERLVRIRGERWRVGSGAPVPPPRIRAGVFTPVAMASLLVVPVVAFGVPVYA
ncbi:ABC transporter permease subunit, partial [Bacillus cereus]|uniref:ABC transporter permease subunit n=2 Tax=Bacillaceae TaxID=186817 RepID=UPI00128F873B